MAQVFVIGGKPVEHYGVSEAASYVGCHPDTIKYYLYKSSQFSISGRLIGKKLYIPKHELDSLKHKMARGKRPGPKSNTPADSS